MTIEDAELSNLFTLYKQASFFLAIGRDAENLELQNDCQNQMDTLSQQISSNLRQPVATSFMINNLFQVGQTESHDLFRDDRSTYDVILATAKAYPQKAL